jgi:hypothetical protein
MRLTWNPEESKKEQHSELNRSLCAATSKPSRDVTYFHKEPAFLVDYFNNIGHIGHPCRPVVSRFGVEDAFHMIIADLMESSVTN